MNGHTKTRLLACGLALLATATQAQTVEYIHTDALGSVVAVTDANGNVIERREYEPYGSQQTPAVTDGPGYTGHVQDAATGLVYMQQRYYDAQIGRFLSVDPVTAHEQPGQNFNRYWYANNNPYRFTDPDGRQACMICRDPETFISRGIGPISPPNIDVRVDAKGIAANGVGIEATKNIANGSDSIGAIPVGEGLYAGVVAEATVLSFELPGAVDTPVAIEAGFDVGVVGSLGASVSVDPGGKVDLNIRVGLGAGVAVRTYTPVVKFEAEGERR